MPDFPIDDLILKFLNDDISSEARQELLKWAEASTENKTYFNEVTKLWELSATKTRAKNFDTTQEWEKFESKINTNVSTETSARNYSFILKAAYRVAAAIIILLIAGIALYFLNHHDLLVKESGDSTIKFSLSDGSTIWLNKNSKLEFPEKFGEQEREVRLTGEAFFEVTKNAAKPFIIKAEDAEVKVLGTSFNVQSYKRSGEIEVFVVTGKVRLSSIASSENQLIIEPGYTGVLNKKSKNLALLKYENPNATAWKSGKLSFRKTHLTKVIDVLQSFYKIKIKVKNPSLLNCRFTSSFDNAKLQEVIETLRISLNLTISHQGDDFIIDGEGCK